MSGAPLRKYLGLALLLEAYALVLACMTYAFGVHTDEAKYLLNIPYPHPPLLRTILGWMDGWAGQELFVRALFATMVVQAVWLIWDLMRARSRHERLIVAFAYLVCATVISQAGTVMFASVTAVQLLCWHWLNVRAPQWSKTPGMTALLWLGTVMTTFQGVLMAPLAWVCLYRSTKSFWKSSVIAIVPVVLLLLYALSNPFVLAAFASHSESTPALTNKLWQTLMLWAVGGSVGMSVLGTAALLRSKNMALQGTAGLVTLYVLMAPQPHYAILFTALFFSALTVTHAQTRWALALLLCSPLLSIVLLWQLPLLPRPTAARGVVAHIAREIPPNADWLLQIVGPFGHEWQYESPWPVVPYNESFWPETAAIVCTGNDCASLTSTFIPIYRITKQNEAERLRP